MRWKSLHVLLTGGECALAHCVARCVGVAWCLLRVVCDPLTYTVAGDRLAQGISTYTDTGVRRGFAITAADGVSAG
eukprot:COSAG01_NODE_1258_length_11012_cov_18.155136_7_plen_76_part_00